MWRRFKYYNIYLGKFKYSNIWKPNDKWSQVLDKSIMGNLKFFICLMCDYVIAKEEKERYIIRIIKNCITIRKLSKKGKNAIS